MKLILIFLFISISSIATLDFYVSNNSGKDYKVALYFKPVPNNQFGPYSQIWVSQLVTSGNGIGPFSLGSYFTLTAINPTSGFMTGPAFCYEGDIIEFNGTLKWIGKSSAISHGIRIQNDIHLSYSYSLGLGFPLIIAKNIEKHAEVDVELDWKIYVLILDPSDTHIITANQFQSTAYDDQAEKFHIGGTINEITIDKDLNNPSGYKVKMSSF